MAKNLTLAKNVEPEEIDISYLASTEIWTFMIKTTYKHHVSNQYTPFDSHASVIPIVGQTNIARTKIVVHSGLKNQQPFDYRPNALPTELCCPICRATYGNARSLLSKGCW